MKSIPVVTAKLFKFWSFSPQNSFSNVNVNKGHSFVVHVLKPVSSSGSQKVYAACRFVIDKVTICHQYVDVTMISLYDIPYGG